MPWLSSSERLAEAHRLTEQVASTMTRCEVPDYDVVVSDYSSNIAVKSLPTRRSLKRTNSWLQHHYERETDMITTASLSSVSLAPTGRNGNGSASCFTTGEFHEILHAPQVAMLSDRERDVVRMRMTEYGDFLNGRSIILNMSLDYERLPFDATGSPTITARTKILDITKRKIYTGIEHFKIQCGIASDRVMQEHFSHLHCFSDDCYRQFSGNAFCLPQFSTIFICLVASIEYATLARLSSDFNVACDSSAAV